MSPNITFKAGDDKRNYPGPNLKRLNLHGKKQKAIKKWHQKVVAEKMKTMKNARSAVIV